MAHEHNHNHHTENNIKIAFFLNLGFALAELVGGFFTNSMAIIADALHDFGDSLSLAFSWRMEKLSIKEGDHKYSYGYRRFSLLSALISAIILLTGSIFIILEAIQRLSNPQHSNAQGMLLFSLVGMGLNGYAALRTSRGKNLNSQMISWHLLEDVLGWAAVLVVSIVLLFRDIHILDPLLSLIVTAVVLYNVLKNLSKTLSLFLQGVPDTIDIPTIQREILDLEMVNGIHHTHIWSLDGEEHVLTTHVVLGLNAKKEQIRNIKNKIRELAEKHGLAHTTIEFEYVEDDCSMSNHNHN
ncbi:MAG TPA: cation diffusion facilitator family transporter [Pelolinea sp.]|nr:cation diffusion facilitator family transporter [Pelolinea sp.]